MCNIIDISGAQAGNCKLQDGFRHNRSAPRWSGAVCNRFAPRWLGAVCNRIGIMLRDMCNRSSLLYKYFDTQKFWLSSWLGRLLSFLCSGGKEWCRYGLIAGTMDFYWDCYRSRGSSGSIVSDYGLDDRGSIPGRDKGFFFLFLRPDRLWGQPSLLSNGYREESFPRG
jgi:hypothetical protein